MNEHPTLTRIRKDVSTHSVVLYMEGTPMFPFDGTSAAVAQCLALLGIKPTCFNLNDEPDLKEHIKSYSDCSTLPQLYIHGQFYGGGPALLSAVRSGEIKADLQAAELTSTS